MKEFFSASTSLTLTLALFFGECVPVLAHEPPPAVGRITYSEILRKGEAICTGTLVAPKLVLTAAHCVRPAASNPSIIRFDAAWRKRGTLAHSTGASLILASPESGPNHDVALIVLTQPIDEVAVRGLPVSEPTEQRFTMIGYSRDDPDEQYRNDSCALVARSGSLLALTCSVVSGNSGAPLLQWNGKGWSVIGVMVASANARLFRSIAALVPDTIKKSISSTR